MEPAAGGSCHPSSILDGKAWRADAKKDCQDRSHIGPPSFCLVDAANPQTLRGLTVSRPHTRDSQLDHVWPFGE